MGKSHFQGLTARLTSQLPIAAFSICSNHSLSDPLPPSGNILKCISKSNFLSVVANAVPLLSLMQGSPAHCWRSQCIQLNLYLLRATHVPGRVNQGADMLSWCNIPSVEWVFHLQTVQRILEIFGKPHDWPNLLLYTIPPIALIPQVIRKQNTQGSPSGPAIHVLYVLGAVSAVH